MGPLDSNPFYFLIYLLAVVVYPVLVEAKLFNLQNNECDTKLAYFFQYFAGNKRCRVNHNMDLVMPYRIKAMVGDEFGESHTVTTSDGYLLTVFRLRHPAPKGVIILHPPYTVDSEIFLFQGNASLSYVLWQAGYDVWLPNHRGTKFSPHHLHLSTKQNAYWRFGSHEIGVFDHTATIDYVYALTGQKVIFIGHSLSTTTSFMYASINAKHAEEKVKVIVATAPVGRINNIRGASIRSIANYHIFQVLLGYVGLHHYIGQEHFPMRVVTWYYRYLLVTKGFLPVFMNAGLGRTKHEFDMRFVGQFVDLLSEQSFGPMYHYGQIYKKKDFVMFDHGKKKNLELYHAEKPPPYPLHDIRVPMYWIVSTDDFMSSIKDAEWFYEQLRPEVKIYGMKIINGINHIEHHFGKHRLEKVWYPVIDFLKIVV